MRGVSNKHCLLTFFIVSNLLEVFIQYRKGKTEFVGVYFSYDIPYFLQLTSYGGFLRYEVLFVLPRNESVVTEALIEPDLILQVNFFYYIYQHFS